ncbi:MAG: type VI secretion system tip protein VgrG [Myxococcales bacterium]|nr:type VI secretion system tip protein VgrG [Myxococcales bacterium]
MSAADILASLSALFPGKPVFAIEVGDVPLRVHAFAGSEAISAPFEFVVEVAGPEFDPETLLGQTAALTIKGLDEPRVVHGIVAAADYAGHTREFDLYELTIVPWAHRLLHRRSSRIFQDKTTQEIVTAVLTGAGFKADRFRFSLHDSYAPRDYCVQYQETDLAFVSRLLEEDGIFYFYEHSAEGHVWVMADHVQVHTPIAGDSRLWFAPPQGNAVQDEEHVHSLRFGGRVRPGRVSLRDFNLHKPDMPMEVQESAKANPELEVYDYPAEYQEPARGGPHQGQSMAKIRLEEIQATRKLGRGSSDSARLTPGYVMTLAGHPRDEFNIDYRVLQVKHRGTQPQALDVDADGDNTYENSFIVTDLKVPFRPARATPRPSVRGMQTATVVGPEGEEIHVDKWGRVRVQFHWDREDKFDETSATWVRVSQLWAGNKWGAMFIPRIGHEVLVDFLEGDPDRPVIVGRIYHGQNEVPYQLPEEKTKSTIKSDSSLGGGGYNELRYEDRKGAEQIFLHAERNIDVRVNNDAFSTVWQHSHVTVGHEEGGKAGDSFVQLFHDHFLNIHRHTKAHLGGDVQLLIGGVDAPGRLDMHVRSDALSLVDGDRHTHTRKSTIEKVDGSVHRIVLGNEQTRIAGRKAIETGDEIHLKSSRIILDAGDSLTIQAAGGHITIDPSGIYIEGTMIYLNSGGGPISGAGASPATAQDAQDAAPTPATPSERGSK